MDRALLIGINHYRHQRQLDGCLNDVEAVQSFLMVRCGFSRTTIKIMPESRATKTHILECLERLVDGIAAGDRVVFHFSGHGSQLPTLSKPNEPDGLDEIICPVDFRAEQGNGIRDRDFRRIFGSVPAGVRFVWISDSCSSGDLSLLAFMALARHVPPTPEIQELILIARDRGLQPLTFIGAAKQLKLALLSACPPNGTAHETVANGVTRGLFTSLLLDRLSAPDGLTTDLQKIVADIRRQSRSVGQIPKVEGDAANVRAPFLGVSTLAAPRRNAFVATPFGAGTSRPRSSSLRSQEEIRMADEAKKPLCRAEYDVAQLPNDLLVITAIGSHPSGGYEVSFEPVDNKKGDTFRFVHISPETETGPEDPFTHALVLTGFKGKFVYLQDATGEVQIDVENLSVTNSALSSPGALTVTDDLGRGVSGSTPVQIFRVVADGST